MVDVEQEDGLPLGRDLKDWKLRESTEQLLLRLHQETPGFGLWDEIAEDRADALVHEFGGDVCFHIECYDQPGEEGKLHHPVVLDWAKELSDVLSDFEVLAGGIPFKLGRLEDATDSQGVPRPCWFIEFHLRADWQSAVTAH